MPTHYRYQLGTHLYQFASLAEVMAKASPLRSGDQLAGVAAQSAEERVVAQMVLAELPLTVFLNEALIPYEQDEVTRLIIDEHDAEAFMTIAHLTVGDFRNWLLQETTTAVELARIQSGVTPEMAAAVSKIMRNQDLILVAKKCHVVTQFRNTIGLSGHLSTRLQPNHPTDDINGIAASIFDGLMYGNGDAVIGINPATDNVKQATKLMHLMDDVIQHYEIPTQSCVLTHVTNTIEAIELGAPVDLVFQSIAGTESTNQGFGINLNLLAEAHDAALSLKRGTVGHNVMYFETGQGSALSANGHHGIDQQSCEARAYAVARKFDPLLVNTVVGFIGPEYLFDGKQITRAGLEDHFCGKLLGLPMGCDICYTNHADADQNDMDNLLTLLGVAECSFIMGIPGSDDIMLNYQTTSFHDALYARQVLGLRPAPEFDAWLKKMQIAPSDSHTQLCDTLPPSFARPLQLIQEVS
ncbi:ethanolamine ammonia-lyase subunit EutB [Vibrio ruber]|uniref:ethanolamine ammonia-lyase subunit EutB n=1 Tax=Vibrio ruber TaxID=184755 RepID=UPI0028931311|nr:ethanolamine ammonia-lyase subunit EutB [Vibrio ruber]WNJ97472.1 ethanolamine ammonia-lyase subunit EutB [Vibrio ruber]